MNEQEEFVPVTKEDGELQTNMHGDVSVGQKHFLEIEEPLLLAHGSKELR